MGIIITEPESLNNGVVLSEYYIGLRKNSVGKVSIHVDTYPSDSNSNTCTLTSYFDCHINKVAKTQGKTSIKDHLIIADVTDLESSNTSIISHLYTELKKHHTNFTDDI